MTVRLKLLLIAILICGVCVGLSIVLVGNKKEEPIQYFLDGTMADYQQDWPIEVLNVFGEPTFIPSPEKGNEQFRFLLLRSLVHSPVVIRIERSPNDVSKIHAKVGFYVSEVMGGEFSGPPVKYTHTYEGYLSEEEFLKFQNVFSSLDICNANSKKQGFGLDGSNWLFEYRSNAEHCQKYVWTPTAEAKHTVAKLMFSLAKIPRSKIEPIY